MTHHHRFGVEPLQLIYQLCQHLSLSRGASVGRESIAIQAALIAYPDRVAVVALSVSSWISMSLRAKRSPSSVT